MSAPSDSADPLRHDAERRLAEAAREIAELRSRLAEAEDTLEAIRRGDIDGLVVHDEAGDRVYTLRTADTPYRALIEQMDEGAATVTADGDITYCNRRFAELVAAPLELVMGAALEPFVEEDDRPALAAILRDGAGKLRTCLVQPGGRGREVHVTVSAVTLDDTESRAVIVTDLSTLSQVQRESATKDEFLAMLAHELRNPLGAISGAAQVLERAELQGPASVHAREVIRRQAGVMARLLDDLLEVGRVTTGKIRVTKALVDLGEAARKCAESLVSARSTGPRVVVAVQSVWIQADSVRLEQIIGNLLSNAVKFSSPQTTVRVEVERQGATAVLRVVDQGSGIEPEVLPHIFDLFMQAEATVDRSKGGLGIGLTLVRRLVELHGGTVEATSSGRGEGSTFTVRLPAVEPEVRRYVAPTAVPRAPRRILLVDDLADAREMYRLVLEADGHEVYEAADGLSALETFRRVQPDVAVIDLGLPEMDGLEVARQIRSTSTGVTLIALTGYGFPEDRARTSAAGFERHLTKPVTPDELRSALQALPRAVATR